MTDLASLLVPGCRVAIGDGVGAPRGLYPQLCAAAESVGNVELIVGWLPLADPTLRYEVFSDVRALVAGWGLRRAIDSARVHAPPLRMSTVPALLHGPLRPDLLVATVVPVDGGYAFGSEVSWQRAAVDAGVDVAAIVGRAHPRCDAGPPLPADRLVVLGETHEPPLPVVGTPPGAGHRALAERVAALIPDGARLQLGPGPLGAAIVDALTRPVHLDSGMLPDGAVELDRRGLLLRAPVGTYLAGDTELFEWADGRPLLHPIEYAHDVGRLSSGPPFVAVNMAVEIDEQAQVNAEGTLDATVGGIGSHPDYAMAAARSIGGLSIVVALPSHHRGKPTLVEQLSMPVSTVGHDVDVVVNENGAADLRGLDRNERRQAIRRIWR